MPSSRGSSQPRDQTPVSRIAGRFIEPPRKSKNTGMSSLSLLQGIFLFQESNQDLLHCRWILYQLSYQGSSENPSIPWINLAWSGVMILLMCCWILFARILFRIFGSMFISDIAFNFLFLLLLII